MKQQINTLNPVRCSKSSLKREVYSNPAYLKKEEQSQMNSLMSQLLKLEKEEHMRPNVSRRDIIKMREEINKIEKNKTIEKKSMKPRAGSLRK